MNCPRRRTCYKARDFIGKGSPGRKQEGKGAQENCSANWLTFSEFIVMGLVSRLCLVNHSDSGTFLLVYSLHSQEEFQWGGFWEAIGYMASFWPFPNSSGWWWLVSSMFPAGISICKVTHADGYYYGVWTGWVVSVSFPITEQPTWYQIQSLPHKLYKNKCSRADRMSGMLIVSQVWCSEFMLLSHLIFEAVKWNRLI